MTYSLIIKGPDLKSLKVLEKTAREMGLETQTTEDDSNDIAERKFIAPKNEAAKLFLEMERKYPPRKISSDVDINKIFDEVNNTDYLFENMVEA